MEQIDISVVMCTFNRSQMLVGAIDKLICQETSDMFSYELVIVNDGSTDNTDSVINAAAENSRVTIRRVNTSGLGYTGAMNTGVSQAKGRFIAFCDDDELPENNWLKELFVVVQETGGHVVGGPCVLALSQKELSNLCSAQRAMLGEHMLFEKTQICRSKHLPGGGNLLVSRHVFDTIGMFDASILTGGCDRELVLRARAQGFDIWYTPKAIISHLIPSERLTPKFAKWSSLQGGASFAYLDRRHYGWIKTIHFCVARTGQIILVFLPKLALASFRKNTLQLLDTKMKIWRAIGYIRNAIFLFLPRVCTNNRFFAQMNFRDGRKIDTS